MKKKIIIFLAVSIFLGIFNVTFARDSTTENDYLKYWGTSYRYGGGIDFFEDNTFFYSVRI